MKLRNNVLSKSCSWCSLCRVRRKHEGEGLKAYPFMKKGSVLKLASQKRRQRAQAINATTTIDWLSRFTSVVSMLFLARNCGRRDVKEGFQFNTLETSAKANV